MILLLDESYLNSGLYSSLAAQKFSTASDQQCWGLGCTPQSQSNAHHSLTSSALQILFVSERHHWILSSFHENDVSILYDRLMIQCDAWFHFQCAHIKRAPDSDWFCSTCDK